MSTHNICFTGEIRNFFFALKIICLTLLKENFYLLQIFIVTPENAWVTKEAAGGADDVRTAVQVRPQCAA